VNIIEGQKGAPPPGKKKNFLGFAPLPEKAGTDRGNKQSYNEMKHETALYQYRD